MILSCASIYNPLPPELPAPVVASIQPFGVVDRRQHSDLANLPTGKSHMLHLDTRPCLRAFTNPNTLPLPTKKYATRASLVGLWVLCGDFNLISQIQDKNNDRLSRRMMERFRPFLNDLDLDELHLHIRLFTWSNERSHPTLERIDRMLVSSCWNVTFSRDALQVLSSRCSDHAPLLLLLDDGFHPKLRTRASKDRWVVTPLCDE
jgi:hypothetical protein